MTGNNVKYYYSIIIMINEQRSTQHFVLYIVTTHREISYVTDEKVVTMET